MSSNKDGDYFNMKGADAYAHKYRNLAERSSKLSAYEIIQTIIGINLLGSPKFRTDEKGHEL